MKKTMLGMVPFKATLKGFALTEATRNQTGQVLSMSQFLETFPARV